MFISNSCQKASIQNLDSYNNEYFSSKFVIRNFLFIICDLDIDLFMLFCDSRVKSLLKYPIFLETVDISCELKTSDLSDDKQFN